MGCPTGSGREGRALGAGFGLGSGGPRLTGVLVGGASSCPREFPLGDLSFPAFGPCPSARPPFCWACPGGGPELVDRLRPRAGVR